MFIRTLFLTATGLIGAWDSEMAVAQTLPQIQISVTDKRCEPMTLTLPEGKTRFIIKNNSMRALEWEILDGVMVVAERENIAPGFYQNMTVDLHPGHYQTTCGLLTNPKGSLTVTTTQRQYQLSAHDIVGISAEYQYYLLATLIQLKQNYQLHPHSAQTRTDYYTLLSAARLLQLNSTADNWNTSNPSPMAAQLMNWTQALNQPSLTVEGVIRAMTHSLPAQSWNGPIQHATQTNLTKLFQLLSPSLKKANPAQFQALSNALAQWRQHPDQTKVLIQHLKPLITLYHIKETS